MRVPYRLEIIESCADCTRCKPGFFCAFSDVVAKDLDLSSHRSTLPAAAILFVEGQMPRGLFILCSGKVKLSTTSRDGKILILKTAEAGEALGLSAAISGQSYEMTAETATPCNLNFVDRKSLLSLLQSHSEVGMHAAQSLSLEFQAAYRDMHDLVLARSSSGKLARLLLSFSKTHLSSADEGRLRSIMTHEENGATHRIFAGDGNPVAQRPEEETADPPGWSDACHSEPHSAGSAGRLNFPRWREDGRRFGRLPVMRKSDVYRHPD